jgi:ribosomal protein L11 methyltransferase
VPVFTAAELWRARFTAPEAAVPALLEALDDMALSVSAFELDGNGADPAPNWQVDLLLAQAPDSDALRDALDERCREAGCTLGDLAIDPVPDTDWLTATARQIAPVMAGRFVVHGSHAREQVPAGSLPIQIDAGLAFGSGEHATTQGCLLAIDRLARRHRPDSVLDLGCGSAVLAIGAARCWPQARIVAADNDPIAVRVATENLRINRVTLRVRPVVSEGYAAPALRRAAPFDLILANILADPLIELAPDLRRHLAPAGHAVLSGLLDRQADEVVAAHRRQGLRLLHRRDIGPWTTLLLRRI